MIHHWWYFNQGFYTPCLGSFNINPESCLSRMSVTWSRKWCSPIECHPGHPPSSALQVPVVAVRRKTLKVECFSTACFPPWSEQSLPRSLGLIYLSTTCSHFYLYIPMFNHVETNEKIQVACRDADTKRWVLQQCRRWRWSGGLFGFSARPSWCSVIVWMPGPKMILQSHRLKRVFWQGSHAFAITKSSHPITRLRSPHFQYIYNLFHIIVCPFLSSCYNKVNEKYQVRPSRA